LDVRVIFLGANVAKQIAGYLGLIETLNAKLDRLAGSEFEAAIRAMEQANRSEFERDTLFREARSRFNKAISLEENERLALSFVGLAFCHAKLGDDQNAREALRGVSGVEMKGKGSSIAKGAAVALLIPGLGPMVAPVFWATFEGRKKKLEELKSAISLFLETSQENS
jgi:hypothetical protein